MSWQRRRYRGNKVWIEMDEAGRPVLDARGLAALRYKPDDERTYTVRPEEIRPVDEELADEPAAPPTPDGESDPIRIFTDGACSGNPGPGGLGVVLLWRGRRKELRRFLGETTNNEAELRAVLEALEAVKRPDLPVEVHTDSEYVIGVLAEGNRARAHTDLVARVQREMRRFPHLRFVKVPAHAGVAENERADALAREAIRSRSPR